MDDSDIKMAKVWAQGIVLIVGIITAAITIGSNYGAQKRLSAITAMVQAGASPESAACAVDGPIGTTAGNACLIREAIRLH